MSEEKNRGLFFPIPYIYQTIPCSIDDSLSYYQIATKLITVIDAMQEELTKIEESVNAESSALSKRLDGFDSSIAELRSGLAETKQSIKTFQTQIQQQVSGYKTEIDGKLEEVDQTVSQGLESINTRLDSFKGEIEQSVQNKFEILSEELKNDIDQTLAEKLAELDSKMNEYIARFNELATQLKDDVEDTVQRITIQITAINDKLDAYDSNIDARLNEQFNKMKEYVDELFTEDLIYYCINPITGEIRNVNEVLKDLWTASNHLLTAEAYAELGLTCEQYEALDMTALEYCYRLYERWFVVHNMYMRCALDGSMQSVRTVLFEYLMSKHAKPDALSAKEFDDIGITAQEYDQLSIGAENYDWEGKNLVVKS